MWIDRYVYSLLLLVSFYVNYRIHAKNVLFYTSSFFFFFFFFFLFSKRNTNNTAKTKIEKSNQRLWLLYSLLLPHLTREKANVAFSLPFSIINKSHVMKCSPFSCNTRDFFQTIGVRVRPLENLSNTICAV